MEQKIVDNNKNNSCDIVRTKWKIAGEKHTILATKGKNSNKTLNTKSLNKILNNTYKTKQLIVQNTKILCSILKKF